MSSPQGRFNYPSDYRIGAGCVAQLAQRCEQLGIQRPLIVTDAGVAALPWFAGVLESLRAAELDAAVFQGVSANPERGDVDAGVKACRAGKHDGVLLVGGGSALDVGKCVALMAGQKESLELFDLEDIGDNWTRADTTRILPSIAVPTTAGTGSEVGRASVIIDPRDHAKKIIFHAKMQPAVVLADPELSVGLPPKLTAFTGLDAFAHCFEAYCAPGYHPMADGIALEGMRLIAANLRRAVDHPADLVARTHMLMASAMGATAFQKGLGLVHALSHPLGGAIGIHHGLANAIFLPYVMVFNRAAIGDKMTRLAGALDLPREDGGGFESVMIWLLELRTALGVPHGLEGSGFEAPMAARLAPQAAADPSMGGNPLPASIAELEALYKAAFGGSLEV